MASVSGNAKKAAAASGDWECLSIRKAGNGFIITKEMPYKPTKDGPGYQPSPPPYLATIPGDVVAYVEHCVGKSEHAAHEKSEKGKPGY